jgi:hypothetical protein
MHPVFQQEVGLAFGVQDVSLKEATARHSMVRLLLSRRIRGLSTRGFYSLWTRASAGMFVLWALSFTATDSWIAETGLTLLLILLLVGGIFLLVVGIRDLIRDVRRFLRVRSEKKSDVSL